LFGDTYISLFVEETETVLFDLARSFVDVLWPIFIFIGLNLMASAYLTTIHKPNASATVSVLRALILPLGFLYILVTWFPEIPFLFAVLGAEIITMFVAIFLYLKNRPDALFAN
jgi:Na+-driven multidrug efflux pump